MLIPHYLQIIEGVVRVEDEQADEEDEEEGEKKKKDKNENKKLTRNLQL